ncbi:hypothetical protein [Evansella halocellulosilytica]|uniref:hypothetical protein n=1 Tax=Evansella halocellulosilytica TaxID=2011013 RepID=UPI001155D686|nr:hypothetical protein [Evansella halocellulosilytica]
MHRSSLIAFLTPRDSKSSLGGTIREISEESLVAPAITRRRKTVLLRLLVAEKQCSCDYSSQKNSAPAITRRRLRASSSARLTEEENASKQLVENSAKDRSLLLRLLVAEKQCSCDYSSQTACFFLCKINRRRECVEAARREFSEESLVAPAVTRRKKTRTNLNKVP